MASRTQKWLATKSAEYINKHKKSNCFSARCAQLKYRYRITLEEYDKMFEEQKGVCAVCSKSETRKYKNGIRRLSVDHNHQTGKVRELLCYNCNSILGFAKDNKTLLLKLALYLEKHNAV